MDIRNLIIKSSLCLLLLTGSFFIRAQFVKNIHDYLPAPGQYTNTEQIGRPAAAQSIIGEPDGLVSLGGFGGYIVVGFEESIENDPANPYGVDFTIFGNATPTWSEAGIVQVMRDDNGNGEPDDTWYEIAGSDHFFSTTKSNYEIRYQNPGDGIIGNINWTDNFGQSGTIQANSYHQQPYYPMSAYFSDINTSELTFSGTLLAGNIDLSSATEVLVYRRAFGYADNTKIVSLDENLPDNPYTEEIEGSGGDAFDISWARNASGEYVELDKIDFIRIYTGMNDIAGWLGEISTEIAGIRDVAPEAVSGVTQMIVFEDLPVSIIKGDKLSLNAYYFQEGKPVSETINWTASPSGLVTIEDGKLSVQKSGTVVLKASLASDNSVYAEHEMKIISDGKATINLTTTTVQKNDKLELNGEITDDDDNPISGVSGVWISGDTDIFSITEEDGQAWLQALNEGQAWLYFQAETMPDVNDSVMITVLPESDTKKVFVSVKTDDTTIFPRQSLMVDLFDLNPYVDNRTGDYALQFVPKITLAHVIAEVFKNLQTESNFRFRDDEKGNNRLYVWKVPETDDGSTLLHHGYGGSRESDSDKRTWIVKLNNQSAVNDLDKTEVNNGDEILIYHIQDNSANWQFTQLTADKDSINKNESVEVLLMQYECSMNANRQVLVSSSDVLDDTDIQVQGGETKQTDEFGKAVFSFSQSGDYTFVSGIDKLNLNVSGTTGTAHLQENEITVYPNPANRYIYIRTSLKTASVNLFDYSGRLMLQHEYMDNEPIDISFLKPGMYIVRLSTDEGTVQQKIIKQ